MSRPRRGSGSDWVGPGQGQGLSGLQKRRKCWLGPGGSGWSGYLIFSFVSAHKIITRDMHVTWGRHYGGIRGVGQKPGPTRTTRTHGRYPWFFYAANPDPSRPQFQISTRTRRVWAAILHLLRCGASSTFSQVHARPEVLRNRGNCRADAVLQFSPLRRVNRVRYNAGTSRRCDRHGKLGSFPFEKCQSRSRSHGSFLAILYAGSKRARHR